MFRTAAPDAAAPAVHHAGAALTLAPHGPGLPAVPEGSTLSHAAHPYYAEITWLAARGIARGYPDGTFRPSATTNRDAMAAYLYRLYGSPAVTGGVRFSDVPATNPFHTEIAWLAASGITTGYPDGTFHPVEPVNRDAMAAFLHRAVTRLGTP